MLHKKVWAVYFSGTGTTEKIVTAIAQKISAELDLKFEAFDFTLPAARKNKKPFSDSDIVIFGVPVIAGRVPNVLLDYLNSIEGKGALAVPVVLYGNRNFDDALIELRDILDSDRFHTIAAGAFVGEHSFSHILAKGRPDNKDMEEALSFAEKISEKIRDENYNMNRSVDVDGEPYPYRGYYQPRDRNGNPIDIRKVVPVTDFERCTDCKLCVRLCPMGSIDSDNTGAINGICMKCCACIKKCPADAKSFNDPGFIYHRKELEEIYKRRGENRFFY